MGELDCISNPWATIGELYFTGITVKHPTITRVEGPTITHCRLQSSAVSRTVIWTVVALDDVISCREVGETLSLSL